MNEEKLVFNGVDGSTGKYLLSGLTVSQIAALARGNPIANGQLEELSAKARCANIAQLGTGGRGRRQRSGSGRLGRGISVCPQGQ